MKPNEKVFVVHHTYGDASNETYKLIGVFSTEASANNAIRDMSELPGFRDCLDGFSIDCYSLDECSWKEGFGITDLEKIVDK